MDVQKLINELAEKEITLWCEGANLKYKAPKGAMTADLLSKIKSGKSEIIDFLNEHGNLQFVRNTKGRYEKFPLTDIQNSYVVGRNTMYTRDGIILFKGREAGDEQVKIHGHRVELAEIRSVLNEHPLVESSVVLAMGESAEDLHINAVVAPVKKKELTSIHITNAEKENLEKLEKYYEEEIDQDLFERWINKSEEVVTSDIFNTFRCYSIFDKNDTVYSFDEIVQKMQIPEKLHKLTKKLKHFRKIQTM